jgi:serine/threonine-protein kinase
LVTNPASFEFEPSAMTDSAEVPAFDLSNRKLGDFQLIRRLGRGGMAEVYLAEQISLKRSVAVKVLRPEFVQDQTYLKRFQQEAKAAAGLNHASIVQVYTIGEADGVQFIAQEYVQGRNLKEYLVRRGALDVPAALQIMRQIASALQIAGSAGIIHRDIKPENILLTRKGEAKVADFGLAQLTRPGEKVELTQVGVTMGTPLYMSPEQVNGKPLDVRSDIYSFGVLCFHMLCGRPPFQGETALSIAVQHLNVAPPPISDLRPDLPKPLIQLVERMMAKKREDRPADAGAILVELKQISRQIANREEVAENKPLNMPTKTPSMQRNQRQKLVRHAFLTLGAMLIVGSASAGVGWLMRTPDPFQEPILKTAQIPRQETAQAQYYYALTRGYDEAAWKSVIEYFPDAQLENRRAKEQLAIIYLKSDRLPQAEQICQEFLRDGEQDPTLRAHGLAGLAVVESLKGNSAASQQYYQQYQALRKEISAELGRLLQEALGRNLRGGAGATSGVSANRLPGSTTDALQRGPASGPSGS